MERILVTGGLGFIGSNFILNMLHRHSGIKVVNLDRMTYAGNPMNLASLKGDDRYSLALGDAADAEFAGSVVGNGKYDCIVNFVAESHVDRSIMSSQPFVHSNYLGTQVLLDAARTHRIPLFIQISTDEVYGSLGDSGSFTEESPIQPNNPYAATKAAADLLCRSYYRTHGMPVIITRCSNNYGPRQFPEKLIPLLIQKALKDERIPVYGDGHQVRDWIYVTDHCRAIESVIELGRPGHVYNIGGNSEMRNIDIVKMFLEKLSKPLGLIEFVEDRPGHDRRYAIDAAKISDEIGWQPEVSFEHGVDQTIEWYLKNTSWLDAIADGSYQEG